MEPSRLESPLNLTELCTNTSCQARHVHLWGPDGIDFTHECALGYSGNVGDLILAPPTQKWSLGLTSVIARSRRPDDDGRFPTLEENTETLRRDGFFFCFVGKHRTECAIANDSNVEISVRYSLSMAIRQAGKLTDLLTTSMKM